MITTCNVKKGAHHDKTSQVIHLCSLTKHWECVIISFCLGSLSLLGSALFPLSSCSQWNSLEIPLDHLPCIKADILKTLCSICLRSFLVLCVFNQSGNYRDTFV